LSVLNSFLDEGCQEKSSASTGGREDFGLEIQPTAVSVPPDSLERVLLWLVCHPCGSSADGDDASRVWKLDYPPITQYKKAPTLR
jgi:hypothetical protein